MSLFSAGDVIPLAPVDVRAMVEWITAIPFAAWPQQTRAKPGRPLELKPAMVNDRAWHGFGAQADALIEHVGDRIGWSELFGGAAPACPMLSVVLPGHGIDAHVDPQPPGWRCRIHVPLTTNRDAVFVAGGVEHHMDVGTAYAVNVRAAHAIRNLGATPRIHFMVDVVGGHDAPR
jgi:hypothetical protein